MPEYSVTITLKGQNRSEIKKRLLVAFGISISSQASITGLDQLPNYHEACRANGHFGCVHWTDADLVARLKELHIPATMEMLDSIKSSYALRHIADRMIETGWESIERAISD